MLSILVAFLVSHQANAADIVIVADKSAAAAALADVRAGVPEATAEPRVWSEFVLARPATAFGAARTETCNGTPASLETVKMLAEQLNSAIHWMNDAESASTFERLRGALVCLRDPIDAALVAKIYVLAGISAHWQKQGELAGTYFEQAIRMQPALEWDDRLTPDARPIFEAAKQRIGQQPVVGLVVVPALLAQYARLDGRPVQQTANGETTITPGLHFVQVGSGTVTTFGLDVRSSADITLVVPSLVGADILDHLAEDDTRRRVGKVIEAVMGSGVATYVHGSGATWAVTTGSDTWRLIGGTPKPFVARNLRARRAWTITAGVAGAVAGVTYAAATTNALTFRDPATPRDELDSLRTLANTLTLTSAGIGLAAAGAASVALTR